MCSEADIKDAYPVGIQFGILDPDTILDISRVHVETQDTVDGNVPKPGGLLDSRMGVIDRWLRCQTCDHYNDKCVGHFGHITVEKKPFFFKKLVLKHFKASKEGVSYWIYARNSGYSEMRMSSLFEDIDIQKGQILERFHEDDGSPEQNQDDLFKSHAENL